MILLLVIVFFFIVSVISSTIIDIKRKIENKVEEEFLLKLEAEKQIADQMDILKKEFKNDTSLLRSKCKQLYITAFAEIPSLNRYTALRNIKKKRYVY